MAHSSEKVGQMKARKSMLPCPFTHIPKHSLHQTTIEESFKKAILANFKFSKPTIISDVIYEVDSDEESPDSSNAFTLLPKIEPSSDICKTEESHTDSKQNNMERSPDIFDEITIDFPGIGDPFPSELPQDETQENSSDLTQNQLVLGETSGLSFFKHHFDTNHNVTNVPYNDSSSPATTQPCRRPTGTDFDYESMEGNSNGERGLKRKDAIGSNSSINLISKPTCSPAKQLKASDAIRRDNLHIGQRIPSPNPSSSSSTIPYLVYNEVSSSISSPRLVMFPTCDNEELTTQKLSNSPSLDSASPLPHTSKTTPPPRKAVNSSAVQKACTTTQKLSNSPSLESASPLPHTSKTTPPPRKAVRNFNEVKKLKEEMSKKLQAQKLELFEKLIAMVFRSPVIIEDRTKIADFLHMTDDEKYILMMLFTDKDGWYNIFKFCTEIQFIGDDKYKLEISEKLQEQGFVETDYKQSDLEGLLKSLTKEELKSIINVLYLAPKTKQMSKADCIGTILLGAGNKLNLKNIVLKEVKKTLGFAFKITQSIRDVFDRVHVLATFSNPQFADIRDYFKLYIDEKGVLPDAAVEDYVIFRTKDEFNNYVSALKLEKELKLNGHKPLITLHVAESAVYALTKLSSATEHRNPRHLQQFTPEHVYCSTLSKCCEQLLQKSNKVGKNWLPFLIQKFPRDGKLGRWYCMLVEFYINEKRYKTAAEVLFEALDEKKLFLKEIDFHELGKLGRTLRQSKKYLLVTAYRDRIIKLIPARIDVSKFSRQRIDISKPLKKSYMIDAILKFYSENDYPGSVPHAGPVLKALLVLYFWDIIYNPTETVSASFVSKLQSVPLDMYYSYFLPYFYQNRKKAIDQRIKQIESEWSIQELIEFGKNNYQNHSHEHGAAGVIEKVIALDTLKIVVSILGISVLVNFFKRLIINMAEAECGMPHLLVWNVDRKAYKFIVCSKSDNSLEISQSLWLDFLVKKEVCVEICHVYSSYKKCKRNSRQESDATGEQIPSGPMSADREESSGE